MVKSLFGKSEKQTNKGYGSYSELAEEIAKVIEQKREGLVNITDDLTRKKLVNEINLLEERLSRTKENVNLEQRYTLRMKKVEEILEDYRNVLFSKKQAIDSDASKDEIAEYDRSLAVIKEYYLFSRSGKPEILMTIEDEVINSNKTL